MTGRPEYEQTEKPLIRQLIAMGWEHLEGAPPDGAPPRNPGASGRSSFGEVVYADRFRAAVSRINCRPDGSSWLTRPQLDHLLAVLLGTAPGQGPAGRGVAGNLEVTRLLREGINARTLPGRQKDDPEHVRLVDWDGTSGGDNDLLAVSQFRVEGKEGSGTPDLVLFVNGLPWVVIECKAPIVATSPQGGRRSRAALDMAVDEVLGYAGADRARISEFTRFAQVLIGTDWTHAEMGTVTAGAQHFAPWRTVYPASEEQVRQETGAPSSRALSDQETLIAGVLRPAHLLTLVRDFTTRKGQGARVLKVVGRFQQFKAVHALAERIRARRRAVAAGEEVDQRGGVVWHTQGSGKSLTMAFLVRHLRSTADLRGQKVVVVTDRIDLEKQIRGSLGAAEEKIYRAGSVKKARAALAVDVPDVVLVMLQKAQRDDSAWDGRESTQRERLAAGPDERDHVHARIANPSHDIVVLIDEAHRGQAAWQHARLRAMLPNAVLVGFTGTPILGGARKNTEDIFGSYADIYTLRDAELDRAVVPVRYEAHHPKLEVVEQALLDSRFDAEVPGDPERREKVLLEFARKREILEAPSVIADKADHMLRHWARTALPDRFGAQIVAVSRLAAVRYREALLVARQRLVARLEGLDQGLAYDPMAYENVTEAERELLDLLPHKALLRSFDAAVVISKHRAVGRRGDPEDWKPWTTKKDQDAHIERFKQGLGDPLWPDADPWEARTHGIPRPRSGGGAAGANGEPWHRRHGEPAGHSATGRDGGNRAPMAFLIVQSMLLTGFDAPNEQVLYLDCPLCGVGLLQAIARTNRTYPHKKWGQVVDYIGVGPDLSRSLAEYDEAHLREVYGYDHIGFEHLHPGFRGEQPAREQMWLQTDAVAKAQLEELHGRVTAFLGGRDVTALADEAAREDLLASFADPLRLGQFDELVRDFLTALNAVLPRPAALAYETAAHLLGETQYLARQRYLDGREDFSPGRYGAKVRHLISRHLKVTGIEERIPPVELTAPDFMERVDANPDPRARTSYLTSRLRLHIRARLASDRARYERFSARLEKIVRRMNEDFEEAAAELAALAGEMKAAEAGDSRLRGLDRWTEQPVYGLLRRAFEEAEEAGGAGPDDVDLIQASRGLTVRIAGLVGFPDFVHLPDAQIRVRREVRATLEGDLHMDWGRTGPLAEDLVELAVDRHADFLRYAGGNRD
ncbi:type I restriction endonuclease subunit R [Streptomyces xinghaiensis]|uniref:type I restriction endonuclease subunit R n=1 Tax=Streptomyces xinghaiensis TaxID=1038928 RepID=UPI00379FD582